MFLKKIINQYKIKKTFNNFGDDTYLSPKSVIKNPQYINIGKKCWLGPGCRLEAWDKYLDDKFQPRIILEEGVKINSRCHIGAINQVYIGKNTLLGSNVMIIDHSHGDNSFEEMKIAPSDRKLYSKGPIEVGENCWICENVSILPNVHIGKCCTIGANAVVTHDIPPYCVAVGNPAKVVNRIEKNEVS